MKDKNEFAKESVVEDYLTDLLTEPAETGDADTAVAKKLLERAASSLVSELKTAEENSDSVSDSIAELAQETAEELELREKNVDLILSEHKEKFEEVDIESSEVHVEASASLKDVLDERFQALFFEVAGLTLAVPLIELGGIHEIKKIAPIIGKPSWFMGVMIKNQDKYNVVNSALWVMPEKYSPDMADNLDYRFVINLGKTPWGLACEKLVNTVELNKSDVKWRANTGKRPWLAGMVKEKMCALINVAELVQMLQSGLSNKQ